MKRNYFLLAILISLIVACEKSEDSIPKETLAIINGETFNPAKSEAKKSGGKFIISFESGLKKIEIVTNDTITGTYMVVSKSLKSVAILQANISYSDGSNTYFATTGAVEIIKNNDGTISGTYSATASGNDMTIEINSGSFANIETVKTVALIETEAAINDTLLLCYSKLQEYIELLYLFDAVYSNNIPAPDGSWTEIYNHTQSQASNNEKILNLWSNAYEIIYKVNLILASSETVNDKFTKNTIIGQAKAIRAYLFYFLSNWFGEIPLETGISESMISRNTIPEVFERIKQDAKEASIYLPAKSSTYEDFRINKFFAFGLLARTYLDNNNFSMADSLAKNIINSGEYALSMNSNNFLEGDYEIIWGFNKKINVEFNNFFTKGFYIPVIRYTEIILIYSVASLNLGKTGNYIDIFNQLKDRNGEPHVTSVTSDEIFQLWKTELAKEGNMFTTLKRFGSALSVVQNEPHKLLLPVPLTFIINNVNLTQNAGY